MDRREPGTVGGELSSSDDKSFGGGDRRPDGSKETGSVTEVGPLILTFRRRYGDKLFQRTTTPQHGKL
jgi:hypothetical protein